jgi:hypothetical protein
MADDADEQRILRFDLVGLSALSGFASFDVSYRIGEMALPKTCAAYPS